MKEKVIRFGISLNDKLLSSFDKTISSEGYTNRSEAIRDLIREKLISKEWIKGKREVVGVITFVYSHHARELDSHLINFQHHNYKLIISSTHIHLNEENCLEVIISRGKPQEIQKIADLIKSFRGVKHITLSMTTTGENIL